MVHGAIFLYGLLALLLGGCSLKPYAPAEEKMVDIREVRPDILIDIRYATPDNFTKQALYPANRCMLRESVAGHLARVQEELTAAGLGLKVWDCYRPLSIQKKLWDLVRDPRYVADPKKGSRHNRGAAVDVTLVDASGRELEMPSAYDDFSPRAHRDGALATPAARENSRRLEQAMVRHGFVGLESEWWHFDAVDWRRFPLSDVPVP